MIPKKKPARGVSIVPLLAGLQLEFLPPVAPNNTPAPKDVKMDFRPLRLAAVKKSELLKQSDCVFGRAKELNQTSQVYDAVFNLTLAPGIAELALAKVTIDEVTVVEDDDVPGSFFTADNIHN